MYELFAKSKFRKMSTKKLSEIIGNKISFGDWKSISGSNSKEKIKNIQRIFSLFKEK
jgi:hypothetical protein